MTPQNATAHPARAAPLAISRSSIESPTYTARAQPIPRIEPTSASGLGFARRRGSSSRNAEAARSNPDRSGSRNVCSKASRPRPVTTAGLRPAAPRIRRTVATSTIRASDSTMPRAERASPAPNSRGRSAGP